MIEIVQYLYKHKIRHREILHWGALLRLRWVEHFVGHLSKDEMEKINLFNDRYFCGYLWHVFSYERRPAVIGSAAGMAFDAMPKGACYIFYNHEEEALFVERGDLLEASFFELEEDVFIVDVDFNWTYVVTHESDCGPYFSKASDVSQ